MREIPYDREKAVSYASEWAFRRNSKYLDFGGLGGDCTNFASQCVYAGAGVMNYTPTFGWFYRSSSDRTASWTGVEYFYNFMTGNKGVGPFATVCQIEEVEKGDIIQLGNTGGFYHTLVVVHTGTAAAMDTVRVSAHDYDANFRPLSDYLFEQYRCLHIGGVRK